MKETLLIVDDVPENLAVLGELLRGAGYDVRAANSGPVALRYASAEPFPDLILLDVMMPEMDGHEVLLRLREDPRTAHLPVILVTAMDSPEDETEGLEKGAVDYITKPIVPSVVLARVRNQLDMKRVRDWLRDQNAYLEGEVARRLNEIRAVQDESERVQMQLNRRFELILDSAGEGICGVDVSGAINFINPAGARMLGYQRETLLGRDYHQLVHGSDADDAALSQSGSLLRWTIETGATLRDQADLFLHADGGRLPVECSCTPLLEDDRLLGAVIAWRDVSERMRYLQQIERKSNFDDLTGLPNRNLLSDRLARAVEMSREDGKPLAVVSLNLDRFKWVNESLGREAGDQALGLLSRRLRQVIASADTLARVEGDEFILVAEAGEHEVLSAYVQPIQDALSIPLCIDGREVVVSASIGIALAPKDGETGETLLRNAAAAMFRAKTEGGQGFRFYAPAMNARALERLELESGLRRAIVSGELVLHYQPQIDLRSGRIIGAEALVRWQDPRRGMVPPGDFIPLAEESGLIVPLGEWVLREACRQNHAWQIAGLTPVTIAVNLSARQFAACDVVALAETVLRETGLDPAYLELELTESAAMNDTTAFIEATRCLKALSISLSIDDFGTGFSSLSYLRRFKIDRFKIDRLKIDRSFVNDMVHDPGSAAIATAIIALAHSLGLAVIAEGVETEAQLRLLCAHDCDEMQGFFFSRPLPAEAFEALLRDPRRLDYPLDGDATMQAMLLLDDPDSCRALKRLFEPEGYRILAASDAREALDRLSNQPIGVVVVDAARLQGDVSLFMRRVRERCPDALCILLTDQVSVMAEDQAGIYRCLVKPWATAELREIVREASRRRPDRPGSGSGPAVGLDFDG